MRLVLTISSILFLSYSVGGLQPSPHPVKDIIQLVVMFVELTVQHLETVDLFKNTNLSLNINNPEALDGIVKFDKIRISGLEALKVNQSNIDFNLTESIFSFCANLSIPKTTRVEIDEYEADIALFSLIPLYGKGKLLLGFQDIDFVLCTKINRTKPVQLTDFLLKPNISGLEFELTGFWNNPQLSEVITTVVATLEEIVMSFWTKEINCITCMLSISLEQVINNRWNPSTSIKKFNQIAEVTKSDCKSDCVLSNNPFLRTIFETKPSDLLGSLLRNSNVKSFVFRIEEYLNQYLEEHL